MQDGEIDLLAKIVDADGAESLAYGLIERFEYQDEAFIAEQFFECTSNLLRKEIARQSTI